MNAPSQYYLSLFKHLLQLKLSSSPSTQSYAFNDKVFSTDISIFPTIPSNKPNFILKEQKIEKVDYYREKVLKMKRIKIERMESRKKLIEERIVEKNRKFTNSFFGENNMINHKTTSIEGGYRRNKSMHQKKDGRGLIEVNAIEEIDRSSKSFHKKTTNHFFEETIKNENSKIINNNKQNDKQSVLDHAVNNNIIKIHKTKVGSLSNNVKNEKSEERTINNAIQFIDTLQEIAEEENIIELKGKKTNKMKIFLAKHKVEEKKRPGKITNKTMAK